MDAYFSKGYTVVIRFNGVVSTLISFWIPTAGNFAELVSEKLSGLVGAIKNSNTIASYLR
jgi:hypothetical protein